MVYSRCTAKLLSGGLAGFIGQHGLQAEALISAAAKLLSRPLPPLSSPTPAAVAYRVSRAVVELPPGFNLWQVGLWLTRDPRVVRLLGGEATRLVHS